MELWRGAGFNEPLSVSVNPTDGSCWVADVATISRSSTWTRTATSSWRAAGFCRLPRPSPLDPADGSCWVADSGNNQVVHLDQNGNQLWRSAGSPTFSYPRSVSVNPTDGSCWVADDGNDQIVHLDQDGDQLWRRAGSPCPLAVCLREPRGRLLLGGRYVQRPDRPPRPERQPALAERRLPDVLLALSVSVNPTDGSCWVADSDDEQVVHLDQNGNQLWRAIGLANNMLPAPSRSTPRTAPAGWPTDRQQPGRPPGPERQPSSGEVRAIRRFYVPVSVSVNPTDGSCWVADMTPTTKSSTWACSTHRWRPSRRARRAGPRRWPCSSPINPPARRPPGPGASGTGARARRRIPPTPTARQACTRSPSPWRTREAARPGRRRLHHSHDACGDRDQGAGARGQERQGPERQGPGTVGAGGREGPNQLNTKYSLMSGQLARQSSSGVGHLHGGSVEGTGSSPYT